MWKLAVVAICAWNLLHAAQRPDRSGNASAALTVTGGDLAWKVETSHFIVDLSRNPGTGRSGQINTIYVKDPGILLTRARPTSTLHLSPNSAVTRQWNGINRWDPPERFAATGKADVFRVEREGQMPNVPGLRVKAVYEFPAGAPFFRVEESVQATTDVSVALLRLCEWSFAPGADNVFSHVGWEDAQGEVVVRKREREETLPLRIRWMGFYSEAGRFSFAAVMDKLEASMLAGECARFSGDPHYFYRVVVAGEPGRLATIPKEARYEARYRVFCFRPRDPGRPFADLPR